MKKLLIHNSKQTKELNPITIASSFTERLVGLLKHKGLHENEALLIKDCKQVHTFFMKFSIDVLFVNQVGIIVGIESLQPWRISKIYWKSSYVVEANYGWAKNNNVEVGNKTEVISC